MKTMFEKVQAFHKAFKIKTADSPTLPDAETRQLRTRILREEWEELLEAEDNNDIVEIADALGDIIYIALGTADVYGINMEAVFEEINRSNMSKLDENGNPIYREDGKVLKGPNYTPPDIKKVLGL